MPTRIRKWPHVVKRGNVSVKIYRTKRKADRKSKARYVYGISYKKSDGKWTQEQRNKIDDAIERAKEIADDLHEGRQDATGLTRTQIEGLAHAQKIIGTTPLLSVVEVWKKAHDLTNGQILPAAQAWHDQSRSKIKKATLDEVTEAFLDAKKKVGRNIKRSYQQTFPYLRKEMGTMQIAQISTARLQDWLNQKENGRTRNTHRKRIVSLFRWATGRGYLPLGIKTSAELTDTAKEDPVDIELVDAETYRNLLEMMRDEFPHYLAATVLAGFCGMRRTEIQYQLWKDINLERRFLNVTAAKPNTPAMRNITLHESAIEWLLLCEKRTGEVCPGTTWHMDRIRKIGKNRGLDLGKNCFRDSYISCRIAATGEIESTALEAGTSTRLIYKHYRKPLPKEAGEDWFSIRPSDESGKVVSFEQ